MSYTSLNKSLFDSKIRLQKPLCSISEVHAKQHVAWHVRLKKNETPNEITQI